MSEPALSLRPFAQPWRWWLARGCPPPFQDERKWVRVLRVSLLLGLLGTLSAWVSAVWLQIEHLVFEPPNSFIWLGSLFVSPGLWFGLIVLLPVSRWRGRNWVHSLLAIPVSGLCLFGAIYLWVGIGSAYRTQFPLDEYPDPPYAEFVCWCCLGLIGAGLLQIWMTDWTRPGKVTRVVPVLLAGVCGTAMTALMGGVDGPDRFPYDLPEFVRAVLVLQTLLGPFQMLVAIALGIPFWNPVQGPVKSSPTELEAELTPADSVPPRQTS